MPVNRELMDSLDTSQIHELDLLSSMSGREEILIDDGEHTFRVSIDAILGYFTSRFLGNDNDTIDITALNSASCIHIIKPGEEIPEVERIPGHFYIRLTKQELDKLYSGVLEDNSLNQYYFQNVKSNISGLIFPDHYYINDSNYKFLKIMSVTLEEQSAFVSETFDLLLVNQISDGARFSKYNKIHFECLFNEGQIVQNSIVLTANDLSNIGSINKSIAKVYCVNKDNNISLWVQMDSINMVLINRVFSLSIDKAPNNVNHINTKYNAIFMDNDTIDSDTDLAILEDTLGEKLSETVDSNEVILKKIESIENAIIKADLDFKYNSVSFNVSSPVNTSETQLNAMLVSLVDTNTTFLIINDDGTVSVSKDGYYAISLKQGFEVLDGRSDVEINVYVNSTRIQDLYTKVTLSSDFKISYLTGQITMRLHTTDKIKVTTKWSNPSVNIENNTTLNVTKYLDCVEDIDFGTLGSEMFPLVGYARVGSARLLLGFGENNGEDIPEVDLYTLPLVDYAKVDTSKLSEPEID